MKPPALYIDADNAEERLFGLLPGVEADLLAIDGRQRWCRPGTCWPTPGQPAEARRPAPRSRALRGHQQDDGHHPVGAGPLTVE
jgi:hypothetical protein